ncbi:MAG TPA: TonB-dependent receptor [Thermoanaerobaculia bacterium]|jgi:outer membrane receptor protein involved in Fe transport
MGRLKLLALSCTLVCTLAALTALPAAAQFANADLGGVVTSSDGKALPGVTVTATDEAAGLTRTTVTAVNGTYAINGLRPGSYRVSFELDGFQTAERTAVALRVGQETRLNVAIGVGAVEEAITVTGAAPLVEVTSKEIGGTLTAQDFETLPTQNRSALLFASLMPGVIPSTSTESTASDALFINGQDDNNNSFNFDGANNDDDVIGARAGAQARTPMEAIQEFQVLNTQFDAEFGRAVGGVLNAVTKSGGNSFTGSVFYFLQDSSFDETDFIAERSGAGKPETTFTSRGFTIGGPLLRDKLHFFLSYEDLLNEEGQARSFSTRPDLNFSTTEDNDIDNYLGKLDYQPVQNHHLAFRYLLEDSPQFNQIIGPVTLEAAREEADTDSSWVLSLESVVKNNSFNTARVSFTKEDVAFANPGFNNNGGDFAAQRNQSPAEVHPGFTGGASTVAQARINRSTQFDDTFSFFIPDLKGEHELRAGFQYSEREEVFTDFGFLNGQFDNFQTDRPFDAADLTTYPGAFTLRVLGGLTAEIPKNETLGLFVQDDWRVTDTLTLNLGFRYDKEDIISGGYLAPRLGFSWDPLGQGKTVVRGGWGRFYDRFHLGYFGNYFLDSVSLSQGFALRFPTAGVDAQALFELAQASGVTTLAGLRDVLAAVLEGGAQAPINGFPTVENPDLEQAYLDAVTLGVEHELRPGWAVSADLIHNEGRDQLLLVDLNPFSTAQGGRPNVSVLNGEQVAMGSVSTWVNAGETDYDALQLSIQKRFDGRFGGRLSYTLADSDGNTRGGVAATDVAFFQTRTETGYDFDRGVIIGEPLDLNLDDARTNGIPVNWHREHNFVISGTYLVPRTSWRDNEGLFVAWVYRYMTGAQTTLFDNVARLDNGNRAPAAPGSYQGATDIGQGVSYDGKLDGAENPDFSRLDVSLRYNVPIRDRFTASLMVEIFNVFDETNFDSVGGTIDGTGTFLVPNLSLNPRQFQLGVRFGF